MSGPARSAQRRGLVRGALALLACTPCCTFPDFAVSLPAMEQPGSGNGGQSGGGATSTSSGTGMGGAGSSSAPLGGDATSGAPDAVAGQPMEVAGAGAGGSPDTAGTVLFSDDFESGNTDNWAPTTLGDWSVVSSGGSQVYKQGTKGDALRLSSAGDRKWTNVSVQARVKVITFGGTSSSELAAIYARFGALDNYYYAALRADGKVSLKARVGGSESPLGSSKDLGI